MNLRSTSGLLAAALLAALAAPAVASTDFTHLKLLSQSEFAQLASDFTAAGSYKAVAPGGPLGITGFDVGVELTGTDLKYPDAWSKAGADWSVLPLPKLHIHKGLPFDVDVGASLVALPNSSIRLLGGELRYALTAGSAIEPAVAVRAAVTRLSGVGELDLTTKSLELTVSKGLVLATPYVGVGRVWGSATPHVLLLQKESPVATKVFGGVNMNFGLINLAAEVDSTGGTRSFSAKLGWRY